MFGYLSCLLLAVLLATAPLISEEYDSQPPSEDENAQECIQQEPPSCNQCRRYRYRQRNRYSWNRDQETTWPGKMEDSLHDVLTH